MAPSPTPTCILRGTYVRSMFGDVPVESLKIGDMIQSSVTGEFRVIRWIGRRLLAGSSTDTEQLRKVHLPVRIARDAIAQGLPARDLYISPGHALLIGEYGVSARLLINGSSIRQVEAMEEIDYFHIELDSHDGMFAEGLPIETYLEADNRQAYDNAAEYEALYPGDDPRLQQPCAKIDIPLVVLERIRANVNKRVEQLELAEMI
ncbi:Hint domain-containing protein [Azospirillum sp. YIM B02556]|uniref:Hint domain-containing protein n=1 Tax=Azospirillum endophyticum TaxID=2800326 RepID=A0ABS1FG67_9PROT|nr:Hint domain-containing protein [Azospirillum endophyticum]MBK1842423.1 Hint domain-containing protein [Azospirillum endophyticum]